MKFPVQIQFRDIDESDFVYNDIYNHIDKLEKFYHRIIFARVIVSAPHRCRHKGIIYHIEVRLKVPSDNIVVSSEPEKDHSHEDVYVAIRDAFSAVRRRLEDFIDKERRRGDREKIRTMSG